MTPFLKTWLNAASAIVSAFSGLPYEPMPVEIREQDTGAGRQAALQQGAGDRSRGSFHSYPGHAHAA